MDEAIKAGDVVQLKSGGPAMTVEGVIGEGVNVAWFNAQTGERFSSVFMNTSLKKAE